MTASREREFAQRAEDIVIARRLSGKGATREVMALLREYRDVHRCTRPHARGASRRRSPERKQRVKVTPALVEMMRSLREEGLSHSEIAKAVGCSVPTVARHVRDGLRMSRGASRKDATAIIEALREGLTLEQVGNRFGKTRERIRQLRVRHESETGERLPRAGEIRAVARQARIAERKRMRRPTLNPAHRGPHHVQGRALDLGWLHDGRIHAYR